LRAADKAHRAKIMKAAKEAIMTCGIDEEAAKKVVLLIRAGEVPNVSLAF
jgi:colicin import membrane protein